MKTMDIQTQENSAQESNVKILNVTIITPSKEIIKDFDIPPKDYTDNEVLSTKNSPDFIEGINAANGESNLSFNNDIQLLKDSDSFKSVSSELYPSEIHNNFSLKPTTNSENEVLEHSIITDTQTPVTKVRKRLTLISDSDSDSEPIDPAYNILHESENITNSFKQRHNFSDDENSKNDAGEHFSSSKSKRLNTIFDSDSEPELELHDKSFLGNLENAEAPVFEVNSKGKLIPERNKPGDVKKSIFSNLFDSESSDDDIQRTNAESNKDSISSDTEEKIKPIAYKKKKSKRKEKEETRKKMTGKQAAQLRKEIKSESQRMLRESNISLPYHKPKSHSLQEFLSRRPKLTSAVPVSSRLPASVAIKMSTEQLKFVSQKLKQREKELKEFYKSESEPESDDNDKDYVPPGDTNDNNSEDIRIIETTSTNELTNTDEENQASNIGTSESIEHNINMQIQIDEEKVIESAETQNSESANVLEESAMEIDEIEATQTKEYANVHDDKEVVEEESNKPDETIQITLPSEDNKGDINLENDTVSTTIIDKEFNEINQEHKTGKSIEQSGTSLEAKSNEVETELQECMSYDFSLDDIEENTEKDLSNEQENDPGTEKNKESDNDSIENILKSLETRKNSIEESGTIEKTVPSELLLSGNKQTKKFEFTDLDREIENFGEQSSDSVKAKPLGKLSKLELIKEKFANTKPRLSGGPDEIIDLNAGVTKPNEVTKLMKRFMSHVSLKKPVQKNKVKLNIVTVECGGDIHEETVAINAEDDEIEAVVDEKPGEKLKKLREELVKQMIEEKSKIWQQKASKGIISSENKDEDIEYADDFDDILDDEDEAEMTDDEESEGELCENDVDLRDKPTKASQSAFVDDEAEESDCEDMENIEEKDKLTEYDQCKDKDSDIDEEENSNNDSEKIENDVGDTSSDYGDNESNDKENEDTSFENKKKSLKRIIMAFEDSDDEDDMVNQKSSLITPSKLNGTTHLDTTETAEEDDMFIPPHQRPLNKTPVRQVTPTRSHFDISTPLSLMSSLPNMDSAQEGSPIISQRESPTDSSSKASCNSLLGFQKKLFSDLSLTQDEDMQQLADICSGQFPATQEVLSSDHIQTATVAQIETAVEKSAGSDIKAATPEVPTSTQDLLNICSGGFTGMTGFSKEVTREEDGGKEGKEDMRKDVGDSQINEVKSLDDGEDLIISQLLDEEELENFKRKFDSPLVRPTQKPMIISEDAEEIQGGGRIDSDDDNGDLLSITKKTKRKKNQKKIVFSDDSSDEEEQNDAEEKIDLYDSCEDEDNVSVDNIGYDSEENEIDITAQGPKETMKLADFFEAEAELSESEWGSDDEDEKDLDKLEFELGDNEKFDEEKVREDIEKLHMKRMLDDDTREVKLLQELLLEDGELHGTGRERQFKWKNIDSLDDDENGDQKQADDDIYLDEEESEEQWRKRRHEREMFLKDKLKSVSSNDSQGDTDTILGTSQILKLGQKVLQRSQSQNNTPGDKVVCSDVPKNPLLNNPLTMLNKRGSFLSRGEQVLQRLAEYTKVTTILGTATAKNTKNFLFQTVSSTETITVQNKKRKAEERTPNIIKKLRLSSSDLSPVNKKKLDKPERAKKLFGNV